MATVDDIKNSVWGLGKQGYGYIVQGTSCIRQRIDIAITTSQGSDPLRPLFGTTIYKQYDTPINIAIPTIKNEIATAIKKWVTDVTVKKITCKVDVSHLTFNVLMEDLDGDTSVIGYTFTNGVIAPISISATDIRIATDIPLMDMPVLGIIEGYVATLSLDGVNTLTTTEVSYSLNELRQWVVINWGKYGTWEIEEFEQGDFSEDFGSDFFVKQYQLVLYTNRYPRAVIQVKVV
jgi:phage baseplate assembly protein W